MVKNTSPSNLKVDGQDSSLKSFEHRPIEPMLKPAGSLRITTFEPTNTNLDLHYSNDRQIQFRFIVLRNPMQNTLVGLRFLKFADDICVKKIHQNSTGRRPRTTFSILVSTEPSMSSFSTMLSGELVSFLYSA